MGRNLAIHDLWSQFRSQIPEGFQPAGRVFIIRRLAGQSFARRRGNATFFYRTGGHEKAQATRRISTTDEHEFEPRTRRVQKRNQPVRLSGIRKGILLIPAWASSAYFNLRSQKQASRGEELLATETWSMELAERFFNTKEVKRPWDEERF